MDRDFGSALCASENLRALALTDLTLVGDACRPPFRAPPADVLLLEVGMGGRDDATNVVDRPAVTILTPIALDHQSFLGSTLTDIARHKAGIVKRGRPCVVARQESGSRGVIEAEADRLRAPLVVLGRDFEGYVQHGRFIFQHEAGLLDLPLPSLAGRHQVENAAVAIAAGMQLGRLAPSDRAIERGIATVRWPGRMQLLVRGGLASLLPAGSELWLDGGHNAAAAQQIADRQHPRPRLVSACARGNRILFSRWMCMCKSFSSASSPA